MSLDLFVIRFSASSRCVVALGGTLRALQAELVGTRYSSVWQAQHMQRSRNRNYEGPVTEHFDGTRFFNPGQPSTDRGLVDILRWRLTSAAARWPKSVPVTPVKPDE